MIIIQTAIDIKTHALKSITELSLLLLAANNNMTEDKFALIKRGVGLSIGRIQTEILDIVYREYPDLDDLKD
jgi:hypothetical protein